MDILNEVAPLFKKEQRIKTFKTLAFSVLVAIFIGISLGNIFFGASSLDTLGTLDSKNEALRQDIKNLQIQNAKLQKQYFELKNIQGF